jgi:hypothetical protein
MTTLTTLDELKQQITLLASVEESEMLFLSCYLNLEDGPDTWRKVLDDRARVLRRILKGDDLADLNYALDKIDALLATDLNPEAKGIAIFVRGNVFLRGKVNSVFMESMQFGVPLPNLIAIYPTPNIYHLVELKDNYHRYIVLLAMPGWARILEVNLGAATTQAWLNHSELRQRVGSEWSRSHYQVNQANRGDQFLHEKITVLEKLMDAGGHTHLILAGDPEITQRIRQSLPEMLADKLVDVIPSNERDHQSDVVMATLSSFIEHEEIESHTIAERLIEGLLSQNLAVVGSKDTLNTLCWGEADTLVMDSHYQPNPGWRCARCKAIGVEIPRTSICPQCGHADVGSIDIREALLRLAGQRECPVEVVEHSEALMALGGVGCLLRTHRDTRIETRTTPVAAVG